MSSITVIVGTQHEDYFSDTMTMSAQRMSETIPTTSGAVGAEWPTPISATWNA
jgi:hypothetical protein